VLFRLISVTYLTTGPNRPVSVTAWILISFPRIESFRGSLRVPISNHRVVEQVRVACSSTSARATNKFSCSTSRMPIPRQLMFKMHLYWYLMVEANRVKKNRDGLSQASFAEAQRWSADKQSLRHRSGSRSVDAQKKPVVSGYPNRDCCRWRQHFAGESCSAGMDRATLIMWAYVTVMNAYHFCRMPEQVGVPTSAIGDRHARSSWTLHPAAGDSPPKKKTIVIFGAGSNSFFNYGYYS